jgi:aspartokinase-like uncharacterized kinase
VKAAVVKLGGSLADAGTLRSWLETLCSNGAGRAVVVPGGGAFADAVRAAQQRHGFSDRAAHRMALLAMEQYAEMLADMAPALRPAESAAAIAACLGEEGIALWLPRLMVMADPAIAESWVVTSDSLAAWLAHRLGAARLILVKSAAAPMSAPTPPELASLGLVDPAFPVYAEQAPFELVYCGPGEERRLAEALQLR